MGKLQRGLEGRLTLWVRQLAWYHATPKPDPKTKRGQSGPRFDDDDKPTLSRIEQLKRDKVDPQMPDNPAPHITDRLIELGITGTGAMGPVPISWTELRAWREEVGLVLAPWEAKLLRRLSAAYLAESRKAESENCPPPCRLKITRRQREVEEAALRDVLG